MAELKKVSDPRVISDDPPFEHPPFTTGFQRPRPKQGKQKAAKKSKVAD
jgi:hypothetical protein